MTMSLTRLDAWNSAEAFVPPVPEPARIAGIGTAVTGRAYSQQDLLEAFQITDPRVRSVFLNSAIQRRYLSLPPLGGDGTRICEAQGDLLDKHKALAVEMGGRAIEACLKSMGAAL